MFEAKRTTANFAVKHKIAVACQNLPIIGNYVIHVRHANKEVSMRRDLRKAATMDSLLESAKTYLEVLQISKSDKVASWKIEDLERAVNWAEYFKRVSSVQVLLM